MPKKNPQGSSSVGMGIESNGKDGKTFAVLGAARSPLRSPYVALIHWSTWQRRKWSSVLQIPQDGFEEDSSQDLVPITETRVAVPENTTLLHGHTLQAIVVVTTLALQVIPLHPEKQGGGETKDDNASTQIETVENGVVGCILGQSSPGGDQATHVAHHGYSREGRGSGGVTGDVDRSPTGANYENVVELSLAISAWKSSSTLTGTDWE